MKKSSTITGNKSGKSYFSENINHSSVQKIDVFYDIRNSVTMFVKSVTSPNSGEKNPIHTHKHYFIKNCFNIVYPFNLIFCMAFLHFQIKFCWKFLSLTYAKYIMSCLSSDFNLIQFEITASHTWLYSKPRNTTQLGMNRLKMNNLKQEEHFASSPQRLDCLRSPLILLLNSYWLLFSRKYDWGV